MAGLRATGRSAGLKPYFYVVHPANNSIGRLPVLLHQQEDRSGGRWSEIRSTGEGWEREERVSKGKETVGLVPFGRRHGIPHGQTERFQDGAAMTALPEEAER